VSGGNNLTVDRLWTQASVVAAPYNQQTFYGDSGNFHRIVPAWQPKLMQ
jgi:hypothetical protein